MEIPAPLKKAIADFQQAPQDQQNLYRLDSAFWSTLIDWSSQYIREGSGLQALLAEARDFINLGLIPELFGSQTEIQQIADKCSWHHPHLRIYSFAEFLDETFQTITHENRKSLLQKDLQSLQQQLKREQDNSIRMQTERRESILENSSAGATALQNSRLMDQLDELRRTVYETKRAASRGVFVSVEKKRENAQRQVQMDSNQIRVDQFLATIKQSESLAQIKQLTKQIQESLQHGTDLAESVAKLKTQIEAIEKEKSSISPLEIENRMRDEIEYIRDLIKLSAKRLRMQSCSPLKKDDVIFNADIVSMCLDRILEFDPLIMKNDRVSFFGKPSVLIVPGYGNALYDWKHNQIVVPLVPNQKDHMASIAAGMIEYRLDVDEDKKLITAYTQLPEFKKIRSFFIVKNHLIKSYITFMTAEYKGFKVLPSTVKKWFDREIAPDRNEVYTPPNLHRFAISTSDFRTLCASNEDNTKEIATATIDDLWVGSIISYQLGKFERAAELLKEYLRRKPEHAFAHFNYAQICAKTMHKQEAVSAFNTFTRLAPQSWWTTLALELVRQLQSGG